jgi:O-antigen ligase
VVSTWISGYGAISYREFLFPLFMVTILLNPQTDISRAIKAARFILLCFVYGSLLSMLIAPGWAYSTQPGLSVIGLNVRLFGLSNQANGLGYIALAYLVLARHHQKEHVLSTVHLLAALAVLILSQSKTAWAAWIVWMIAELTFLVFRRSAVAAQSLARWLLGAVALAVICVTVLLLLKVDLIVAVLGPFSTLTGRTSLWEIAYRTWLRNPLFGYGANIWDVQFRLHYGYLQAGQAHNQLLQTLGESGLVGLTGVLIYIGALITLAARYARISAGTSFALVLVLLVRSFTEAPLRTYLLDGSFLVHSILFFVLVNGGYMLQASSNNSQGRTRVFPRTLDARNRYPNCGSQSQI